MTTMRRLGRGMDGLEVSFPLNPRSQPRKKVVHILSTLSGFSAFFFSFFFFFFFFFLLFFFSFGIRISGLPPALS